MNLWEMLRKHVEAAGPSDDDWRKALKVRDELKAKRKERQKRQGYGFEDTPSAKRQLHGESS